MKTTLLKDKLTKALQKATRTISPKSQLPVLQNILLECKKEEITIVASSMESTSIISVSGKTQEEGALCVPAKVLFELVNTLADEQVVLSSDGDTLVVENGGVKAQIPCIAPSEFPSPPVLKKGKPKDLPKEELVEAVSPVLFCAATDDSRPVLTGIYIETKEDETVFAATDGYRLMVKKSGKIAPLEGKLLISSSALSGVIKTAGEAKEEKTIGVSASEDGQPAFIVGDTTIFTRKIDGDYPAFEKIIPKNHTTQIVVDKGNLEKAVKSAAIFARDNANIVKIHIEDGGIIVSANTPSVGQNTVHVDGKMSGDGGDIAFNSRFLLDYLSNTGGDEVLLEMTGSVNPGVFRSPGDDSRLHIIMPVRVQA